MSNLKHKDEDEFLTWDRSKPLELPKLKKAFAKLTDPNVSEYYLSKSMKTFRGLCEKLSDTFQSDLAKPDGPKNAHAALAMPTSKDEPNREREILENWVEAGLVTVLLKIADSDVLAAAKTARVDALLAWCALLKYSLSHLPSLCAHRTPQNVELIKDVMIRMLRAGPPVLQIFSTRCIQLWAPGFWSSYSFEERSELISHCLTYAQESSPQPLIDILRSNKRAQLESLEPELLNSAHPREILTRHWSRSRDEVLSAVTGCLSSGDRFDQQRKCLEIVKARPYILHQLLSIIDSATREKSDPDYLADNFACQILTFFLNGPAMWILDFGETDYLFWDHDFPSGVTRDHDKILLEWAAAKSVHKYFISLQDWKCILLKKWNQLQCESHEDILKKVKEHVIIHPVSHEAESQRAKSTGTCRSCILRILVNLTYECEVPTSIWFSFLTLAYEAAQKVPSEARAKRAEKRAGLAQMDFWVRKERMIIIERRATCLSLVVASPYTLGPLLLLRIIRCIYKAYGNDVASWNTLPENTLPDDHLRRVQQIASEEVLGAVIRNIILSRIPYMKQEGTRIFEQNVSVNGGRPEASARSHYWFAAELAVAVKALGKEAGPDKEEWAHLVPSAEKELVACFGNISLMSSKLEECYVSWRYANFAVTVCNKIHPATAEREGWNLKALKEKNMGRRSEAAAKLRLAAAI